MTVPPYIYLGPTDGMSQNEINNLKMHEYGHFLQFSALQASMTLYLTIIGGPSILSAGKHDGNHHSFWTEVSANILSYNFFGKPSSWDTKGFPLKFK